MTPFIFFFTLCTINHSAPYLTSCQPLMIPQQNIEKCELYKKKFMAKAPVWSNNPAHPYFAKQTAAPITEPMCIPNPHMNHIDKHIKGQRYADERPAHLQPPFKNEWKGRDYKEPGKYDAFMKTVDND